MSETIVEKIEVKKTPSGEVEITVTKLKFDDNIDESEPEVIEVSEIDEQPQRDLLATIEKGQKPWFLTSSEIYKLVKSAIYYIPKSELILDQTINVIAKVTKYINDNTHINVVLNAEDSYNLINKLDEILAQQLVVLDDGFDSLRAKLSSSLRMLISALVKHKDWAENYAKDHGNQAKEALQTRYERALGVFQHILTKVQERFPHGSAFVNDTYEKVVSKVEESRSAVRERVEGYAAAVLGKAQPYVHRVVEYGAPYVQTAVYVSSPIVKTASPYVIDPVLNRAVSVENQLKENKYIGHYVEKVLGLSYSFLGELKAYAIPPSITMD